MTDDDIMRLSVGRSLRWSWREPIGHGTRITAPATSLEVLLDLVRLDQAPPGPR